MKVLLINGSMRTNGCGNYLFTEVIKSFDSEGIETELISLGNKPYSECIGCYKCTSKGECIFKDVANEIVNKMKECDGILISSPVYFSHPSSSILAVLDRVFMSGTKYFEHKVAGSIVSLRKGRRFF